MQIGRGALMIGATILVAAATGHVMEYGGSIWGGGVASPASDEPTAPLVTVAVESGPDTAGSMFPVLVDPDAPAFAGLVAVNAITLSPDKPAPWGRSAAFGDYDAFGRSCRAASLTLAAAPGAMVDAVLEAPCHPDSLVEIGHAGLAVLLRTDAAGRVAASLPAFAGQAEVKVTLPGGAEVLQSVDVPDIGDITRTAVLWAGGTGISLHAFENGAGFGEAGHVHPDAAGPSPDGGFLVAFGEAGQPGLALAQVYTGRGADLDVRLELTAVVTEARCGRRLEGRTVRVRGGMALAEDFALTMPECSAVGDMVVMKLQTPLANAALTAGEAQP